MDATSKVECWNYLPFSPKQKRLNSFPSDYWPPMIVHQAKYFIYDHGDRKVDSNDGISLSNSYWQSLNPKHWVLVAGFYLFLYGLHVPNEGVNIIESNLVKFVHNKLIMVWFCLIFLFNFFIVMMGWMYSEYSLCF